jgi:hypothetical protein
VRLIYYFFIALNFTPTSYSYSMRTVYTKQIKSKGFLLIISLYTVVLPRHFAFVVEVFHKLTSYFFSC